MQTQTPSINSTCYASDHILNMHVQCGTLTRQIRKLFWRQCKVCCMNWNVDYESMLGHMSIPTSQQRRIQLKASMMDEFVHGDSYIPEDVLLLHPPSNHDTRNCSCFPVPYARTNGYYYSFFPHVTFLELTSTYCSTGTE